MKHFIVVFLGLIASPMFACSDIALPKAEGQPVVSAREMDFNCTMWSEFIVSPRGFKYTGYTPNSRKGMTWENKYGFIAINFVNIPVLKLISKELYCDGMNETGLSAGLLWLESSKTPNPSNEIASKTMCQLNVVAWVLGRCSTVKEVLDVFDKENPDIYVWMLEPFGVLPTPLHLVVHDAEGNSATFEWLSETTFRPVITTGPTYTYSMTNDSAEDYSDYMKLNPIFSKLTPTDPFNPVNKTYNVGGGTVSMPGDSDSSPRWLRGHFTMLNATPTEPYRCSSPWRVIQAFRSIAHTNIIYGESYNEEDANDTILFSPYFYMDWTVIRDHTNKIIYYYSSRNHQMQTVKLSEYQQQMEKGKDLLEIGSLLTLFKDPVAVNGEQGTNSIVREKSGTKTLSVAIPEPESDNIKAMKIFVYVKMQDGTIKFWDGAQWKNSLAAGGSQPCLSSDALNNGTIEVPLGGDPDSWKGAEFHAGSGISFTEMMIEDRCAKIKTGN